MSACGDGCAMSICYCDVVGGRPCGVCAEWQRWWDWLSSPCRPVAIHMLRNRSVPACIQDMQGNHNYHSIVRTVLCMFFFYRVLVVLFPRPCQCGRIQGMRLSTNTRITQYNQNIAMLGEWCSKIGSGDRSTETYIVLYQLNCWWKYLTQTVCMLCRCWSSLK